MSSRKRKNSINLETTGRLSKRAKILSTLWQSQEQELDDSGENQSTLSGSVYGIRAIIGERRSEYLIDWADDPITGQTFDPDWQPKVNVNTAAIKIWEAKQRPFQLKSGISRPRRQRRRRKVSSYTRNEVSRGSPIITPIRQTQYISETPSRKSNSSSVRLSQRRTEQPGSQSISVKNRNHPNICVHISQKNSLNRNDYIDYQALSSSSNDKNSAVLSARSDIVSGIVSEEIHTFRSCVTQGNSIVPDSQSLPGSSSYVNTSGTSAIPTSVASSGISNTSGLEVAATQTFSVGFGSSLSLGSSAAAPPLSVQPPSLPRSASDPTSNDQADRRWQRFDIRCTPDSHGRSRSFSLSRIHSQQSEHRLGSPEEQIPESPLQSLELITVASSSRQETSPVFQTQVPLAFPSQGSCGPKRSLKLEELSGDGDISLTSDKLPLSQGFRSKVHSTDNARASTDIIQRAASIVQETIRRGSILPENFEISDDNTENSHPSQATTTDNSILSPKDPNSQIIPADYSEQSRADFSHTQGSENSNRITLSSDLATQVLPSTLGSFQPPQPPIITQPEMSEIPQKASVPVGVQDPLGPKEKLRRRREENATKKEAARAAKVLSNPSSARASPTVNVERQLPQSSAGQTLSLTAHGQQQQPISPVTRALPALSWSAGSQPLSPSNRASPAANVPAGQGALCPGAELGGSHRAYNASGAVSPSSREQSRAQVQSPDFPQSRADTTTPEILPDELSYQVQEEPERLEVQPVLISTELPLPMRSSQSVPHTPATPSRLSMHKETSPSRTVTLKCQNMDKEEFIVPLCMQKRILKQYIDTIEYYPTSIKENMTRGTLSQKSIAKLNELLVRLANVTTHIGLEGGGPGSQESVRSEQEALYAESSSEKFKFLSHLFHLLKNDDVHIAVFAQSGPLHDIVELFLKGKKVHYNRPGTFSRSHLGNAHGQLQVSLLSSSDEGEPEIIRRADLVIALDETFNANHHTAIKLRQKIPDQGVIVPVIRLIVYSSIEHLDLCFPRTLEPIDRLRKLIFSVCHTQSMVGELQDQEPDTRSCALDVANFVRRGGHSTLWPLPNIRPIENIPVMDSDSSLSDAMSDVSAEVGRPHGLIQKYWPGKVAITVEKAAATGSLGGKRPFDLDYGDSLEVQAKKQKMAQRAHAGQPINEPPTVENLENWLKESKDRVQRLIRERNIQKETIISFKEGAERRQATYEDLRDKSSDLHHDKLDLVTEVAKLKKELDKARIDRLALHGERGRLNKDIEEIRQQLLNHSNPIIAVQTRLEMRVRDLEAENASVTKKLDLAEKQLGYTRQMYQESTSQSATLSQELEELQQKMEPMETQLQHERARRKHERENDMRQPLFEEIANLRYELQSREKIIVRKEEEIKDMKRGRGAGVQTRGSSVQPRSPRGGSRGASPAAGLYPGGTGGSISKGPSGLNRPFNLEG